MTPASAQFLNKGQIDLITLTVKVLFCHPFFAGFSVDEIPAFHYRKRFANGFCEILNFRLRYQPKSA
jgi:hypothetical protein